MYQFSRRVLTIMLCLTMLFTCMTTVTFGQTSGTQEYATKVLYALDQNELLAVDMDYANDVIKASADDYSNVEVMGVTDGIRVWKDVYYDGSDSHPKPTSSEKFTHSRIMFLTAGQSGGTDTGVKNITYKITSSNPNGFEQLDISFLGRVDARADADPAPFLAVQGSDAAPSGAFGGEGYFDGFTDLRRITESDPVAAGADITIGHENETPDYYNFGETITLTNEVKGKSEYYVNFSYVSEELLSTALTDISFAEKVPVEFSNADKYEDYIIVDTANAKVDGTTAISHAKNRARLWTNADVDYALKKLGFEADKYESGSLQINGYPYLASVDPAYGLDSSASSAGKSGFSFFPVDWGFSSLTFKVVVPTGRKIEGLTVDYDGNLTVKEGDGERSATSITTYVGDSATELGLAKRFVSYTNEAGAVAQNLGTDLDAFTVEGNGKDEIWVRLMIAGGDSIASTDGSGEYVRPDNYINKIKITAHLKSNKVSQGTEITDASYAAKSLYALDMGKLAYGKTALSEDMTDEISASDNSYSNVEILGVTSGLQFNKMAIGNMTTGDAEQIPVLTSSAAGVKNITYKITSANPDGFDELDISYLAGVNSTDGSSYVNVSGSDEAPIGDFGSDDYYNNFGVIRNIADSTPGTTNVSTKSAKDYHDYGETLILTDAVKGKTEYYVNFSINAEGANKAWLTDIAFTEKIETDFSDTDRYTTVTLTDMDYTGRTDGEGGWIGYTYQTSGTTTAKEFIAATNDYCEVVNIERWLQFKHDGSTGVLSVRYLTENEAYTWTSGSFVLKLTAPEGKVFKGLNVDLKGVNTIDTCAGANKGTSITASVSDEFAAYDAPSNGYQYKTGMGAVKRFYSYTDENSVVHGNLGALTPFKVVGNNKNVMYLQVKLGNGDLGWNHLTGMKIDGIFADESVIDDVVFSGNGAFPTNGTLSAMYKVGTAKTGEEMPEALTFILAAYQNVDGVNKLLAVKVETIDNITENTNYTVALTGLPVDENNCSAKAFVWSDISDAMTPISNVYKLATE